MTADVTGSLFDRGSSVSGPIQIESNEIKLSMLDRNTVIFGPPGTGKTRAIEHLISQIKDMSEDPENPDVAYLTYSRAMAHDARSRIQLPEKSKVGTFHSILHRQLGWIKGNFEGDGGSYLSDKQVAEFCARHGITRKGRAQPDREDAEGDDDWSKFLMLYERAYSTYPIIRRPSLFPNDLPFNVDVMMEKYNELKRQTGKHDYVDILVYAHDHLELPHVKYLFLDEAQDMNPLMWRIVDKWPKDVTVIAGDDDQSIYEFRGATPQLFLDRRKGAKIFHLSKTHRFGSNILGVCRDVSRRIQSREEKEYLAAPIADRVTRKFNLEEFLDLNGSKMMLFRTKYLAAEFVEQLIERKIPFLPINTKHGWISPWSRRLITLNNILSKFPDISDAEITLLVDYLPAAMLRRGVKTKIEKEGVSSLRNSIKNTLVTSVMDLIFDNAPTKDDLLRGLKIPDGKKRLIQGMKEIEEKDVLLVDTFHAAKGTEANNVAVALDMTRRIFDSFMENPDSEWRALYVAVSRAMNSLTLLTLNITEWRYPI